MTRHKTVSLHPYKCDVLLVCGGTWKQAHAFLVKRGIAGSTSADDGDCIGRTIFRANGTPLAVWVSSRTNVLAVVHESLHVVCGLLSTRGLKFTYDSDEAYAYLLEFVVESMMDTKGWK